MESSETRRELSRAFPPMGVRVVTPRLVLQMPHDEDLPTMLRVIDEGIHDPAVMPFSIAWTDSPKTERERLSLSHWWGSRANWTPTNWHWSAAVYVDGEPIGGQGILATDFATKRQVNSGSWLGMRFQGQGLGKEMRAAVLHLAFAGLGAVAAHSGYVGDNIASRRVSEAMGYLPNGYEYEQIRGELTKTSKIVLERSTWEKMRRDDITIEGLDDAALEMFGAG